MSDHYYNRIRKYLKIEHWQFISAILVVYDLLSVNLAYIIALWLRFDCRYLSIPAYYVDSWKNFIPIYSLFCLLVFYLLKLYSSVWRFASYFELYRVIESSAITSVFHLVVITVLYRRMPISYYVIGAVIQMLLILGIRFSYRFVLLIQHETRGSGKRARKAPSANVMVIGAGSSGQMIIHDMNRAKEINDKVCCLIDDDPNKWNRFIDGVKVVGGRNEILRCARDYAIDKIYITMPGATAQDRRDILAICSETGCELKQLPGMYQLVSGQVTVGNLKEVSTEDLLGRDPIKADLSEVMDFIRGKVVLVTGGGGSIGSELARQIAGHDPGMLILLDIYENNVYDIQLELREKHPTLNLLVLIGSVRDSRRIFQIFKKYRPDVVYHAAAHKHVPLMEDSPCEAVKNNAIGTYKTAYAAMVNGCSRFVLISTDKAVNPTNIMGASKRLCEMIIQSFDSRIKEGRAGEIPQLFTHEGYKEADRKRSGATLEDVRTEFVAVRFGNVLGSNGSVIPIFKKQIEKGGPVTVTHPDIIRYFMTIPEAVSLVLLAGTYARGGEIFVLDMGSPVKIDTLARNLIRLSGYKPDVDIKIEYTGLRPGEKLYEEKLMAEEGLKKTDNDLIHIGCPIPFNIDSFLKELENLMLIAYTNDERMKGFVEKVVPTYHPET